MALLRKILNWFRGKNEEVLVSDPQTETVKKPKRKGPVSKEVFETIFSESAQNDIKKEVSQFRSPIDSFHRERQDMVEELKKLAPGQN